VAQTFFKAGEVGDDLVTFTVPGERGVSFGFTEPAAAKPEVKDNVITYPELYQGLDVKYTTSNSGVIEEIIVKSADQASGLDKINQKLIIKDAYYKEQPDGSISFHDPITRNLLFIIPAPVMYELNNLENSSMGLHYEITEQEDESLLVSKVIDQAGKDWLAQATYPVAIDYSYLGTWQSNSGQVQSQDTCAWCHTSCGAVSGWATAALTNERIGTTAQASCSNSNDTMVYYRNYLSFATGTVSSGYPVGLDQSLITGATLNVYMYRSSGFDEYPTGGLISVKSGQGIWSDEAFGPAHSSPATIWNAFGSGLDETNISMNNPDLPNNINLNKKRDQ